MGSESAESKVKRLRFECTSRLSLSEFAAEVAQTVARELSCDEVCVRIRGADRTYTSQFPSLDESFESSPGAMFEVDQGSALFKDQRYPLPLLVSDLQRARVPSDLALELAVRKVRSFGAFPLVDGGELIGVVECSFTRSYHRWKPEEVAAFDELSHSLSEIQQLGAGSASRGLKPSNEDLRGQYRRMARYGNVVIIITDANFGISDVFGNTEQLFGVHNAEMIGNTGVWDLILHPKDRRAMARRILRLRSDRDELREEVRVIHQVTGEIRWMMLRAQPHFSTTGVFQGWEGFGIDITDRRRAQEALITQNRRLEALFEVARSLQGHTDPAIVTLKGLKALLRATSSRCGFACFFHRERNELEVVAALGLSERYIASMEVVLKGPSLLRSAVEQGKGFLVGDLQEDHRAAVPLAKIDNLHSCIVMPLATDHEVFGAIVLFKREIRSYTEADFELVSAATTQMTLAVRQAEMFEVQRRHNESLRALYQISHELAKYRSPKEIAEHAFPILQKEFALKRGWFGVLNEQATHIAGKAGFGPGIRRYLQEVQIELALQHDFLDEAVRTHRPIVVDATKPMECSGLNRVLRRLKLETLVIVPLVSVGQVVGVLVVEPVLSQTFVKEERLQLLVSMTNEMATVVMARRFESKMAEALKMRMAGLLASGVAHNFNNLLQAVMGQVSLIDLQLPHGSPAREATKTINEAARRGAGLVSQLLNFATQSQPVRESVSVSSLLHESRELYNSLLTNRVTFSLETEQDSSEVEADPSQIQQVITNLLINAKDAVAGRSDAKVRVSTRRVKLRSGEVDPELPPGSYLRLDVTDNGVGMDAERQARCFEPFFTTKNVDRGTGVGLTGAGLGLAAAYSIVKQHEGVITVHSMPFEGSTFSVFLPLLHDRSAAGPQRTPVKPLRATHCGALLLGLDGGVQPFVSSIFESLGYRSRSVFDLQQAVNVLSQHDERWGFAVIDIEALGDLAESVCTQLLTRFSELCVIACTSSVAEWSERLRPAYRVEVLEKPLGVWSVELALQRLSALPFEVFRADNGLKSV